jgi:5-methylthioadenosine/S-adenosylhomocysteine deaminase
MTLMRNAADDLPLHEWLFNKIFPMEDRLNDEDIYWGTSLAAVEMIKSGTTALADMYLHMDSTAKAISETGIRANLSRSPVEFHSDGELKAVDVFEECREYYRKWHGSSNGRIKVYVEVHSTYLFD